MSTSRPGFASIPDDASPVERWWLTVRAQTSRQLPLESALSWPTPIKQKGALCLAAFYYGVKRVAGPGTSVALPPIARVVASYPQARLLAFVHRQATNLFPGLPATGELGPLVAVPLSPSERMRERRALFALYTSIINQYDAQTDEPEQRSAFRVAFNRLAEPGLLPYYCALNPEFFDWLGITT